MRAALAIDPGDPNAENEDVAVIGENVYVVLDGLTARTETGCIHGVAWFAHELANAIVRNVDPLSPQAALEIGIRHVVALHANTCDLARPATPCAAAAIAHVGPETLSYAILGDVSIVLDIGHITAISDPRITTTAAKERQEADAIPIGDPTKPAALRRMKVAELATRNTDNGYWIAGARPEAAKHPIVGEVPRSIVRRLAVLTDGAARAVEDFHLFDWPAALDLLSQHGPSELIRRVRQAERSDAAATRRPRNKVSDDAAVIFASAL